MIENCFEELKQHINIRENLSLIRSEVKNPDAKKALLELPGIGELLDEYLMDEDAKVRKNAALLLGDLNLAQAAGSLFCAYEREEKLFVKSAYLTALSRLDASEYLEAFKERRAKLTETEPAENERKHIAEELRELERLITGIEGVVRHTFTGLPDACDIVLTAAKEVRSVTAAEAETLPPDVRGSVKPHPLGVLVHTKQLRALGSLRTYRELLFPVHMPGKIAFEPLSAAAAVWKSDLPRLLTESHRERAPFYFRLEVRGRMDLDKKSSFAKKFCTELERLSKRAFINSTRDYEVEIRLVELRDGGAAVFLKLFTVPTKRFSYRRNAIAASIHPATAAALVALAKPYLLEDAQIIDPFCGVGTMLVERDICVPAKEKYGIDIYGDAVGMARENAQAAGVRIHFINRDYFDFRHEYLFDEIITNMPVRGRKTKEETDIFYADFFTKSAEVLKQGAVIVMYSNEQGFVKKQLRLRKDYRLKQEYCIREKDHFYLFVIKYEG